MRSMLDAAWPPLGAPVGHQDIVAFYIGGGTPHVWTASELDQMLAQTGAKGRLPIFVRVPPTTRDPAVEGAWCVQWARSHGQPPGTCIALDYEMAVDNAYWTRFDDAVTAGGYRTLLYGTLSRVVLNVTPGGRRPSAGYWSAHWTNTPHICPNPGVTATQYGGDSTLNKPWDLSLVGDRVPIWGYTTQEADLDATEHGWLKELHDLLITKDGNNNDIDTASLALRRLKDGVTVKQDTNPNLADLTSRIAALQADVDVLKAGVPVTLTDAQLASIKASIQTLEGSAMVQLAVSPAP